MDELTKMALFHSYLIQRFSEPSAVSVVDTSVAMTILTDLYQQGLVLESNPRYARTLQMDRSWLELQSARDVKPIAAARFGVGLTQASHKTQLCLDVGKLHAAGYNLTKFIPLFKVEFATDAVTTTSVTTEDVHSIIPRDPGHAGLYIGLQSPNDPA